MADPGRAAGTFGPTEAAPHGGAVLGGVTFVIQADATLVRANLEQARQIAQQISPDVARLINWTASVDTTQARQQLQQLAQQARQTQEQVRQAASAGAAGEIESIGTATSGPLGARAFTRAALPPLDTVPFKRSTDEAVAALRQVGNESVASGGLMQRTFAAAGQQLEAVAGKVSSSWTAGLSGVAVGLVAFQGIERVLGTIIEQGQAANQAMFALGRAFGDATPQAKAFAESLSGPLGLSITQLQSSEAELQRIGRVVGLSVSQVQQLTVLSANLAAISGRSQEQAGHAVAAAFIGQPRGLDLLGLPATKAILKSSGELEEARQRDADATELQIHSTALYNLLQKESAGLQDAAAARAKSSAGAYDNLSAATNNLAASIGSGETPLVRMAAGLATVVDQAAALNRHFGILNTLLAETTPLLGAVGAAGEIAAKAGPPPAGRPAVSRFPTRPLPYAPPAADVAEQERHHAASLAASPTFTPPPLPAPEQFGAALSRQEAVALAAKKSIADLSEEQVRHAQVSEVGRQVVILSAQADANEAQRHRAIGVAMRDRTVSQIALNKAISDGLLLAENAANLGQTDAVARHVAPPFLSVPTPQTESQQQVLDAIRAALSGAKPGERDALAQQLAALSPLATGIATELATDPVQHAKDALNAVQEARQRDKEVQAEIRREVDANQQLAESAQLERIRRRGEADVRAVQDAQFAEEKRYAAQQRAEQDEQARIQERYALEQKRLGLDEQLATALQAREDATAAVDKARADLERLGGSAAGGGVGFGLTGALGGAGGLNPLDPANAGQRGSLTTARDAYEKAVADRARAQLAAAQAAAEEALTGQGAVISQAERATAADLLQSRLAAETGLDPATRARAQQLIGEIRQPASATEGPEHAAVDRLLGSVVGQQSQESSRDFQRAQRDAQDRQAALLIGYHNQEESLRLGAQATYDAAQASIASAHAWREVQDHWAALGLPVPTDAPGRTGATSARGVSPPPPPPSPDAPPDPSQAALASSGSVGGGGIGGFVWNQNAPIYAPDVDGLKRELGESIQRAYSRVEQ